MAAIDNGRFMLMSANGLKTTSLVLFFRPAVVSINTVTLLATANRALTIV